MDIAQAHVDELAALSPLLTISSPMTAQGKTPHMPSDPPDLDSADELAARALILGIVHRTAGHFVASREFLLDALERHKAVKISTWVGGLAAFELAVLELKEAEASFSGAADGLILDEKSNAAWLKALRQSSERLEQAMALSPQSIDMSSRLDSRVTMLRDEIATKREMVEMV